MPVLRHETCQLHIKNSTYTLLLGCGHLIICQMTSSKCFPNIGNPGCWDHRQDTEIFMKWCHPARKQNQCLWITTEQASMGKTDRTQTGQQLWIQNILCIGWTAIYYALLNLLSRYKQCLAIYTEERWCKILSYAAFVDLWKTHKQNQQTACFAFEECYTQVRKLIWKAGKNFNRTET